MTCDCGDDEDADAPGDEDASSTPAEVSLMVGDSDGVLSAEISGSDEDSLDDMVESLRDVMDVGSGYLDRDADDTPSKGVQ